MGSEVMLGQPLGGALGGPLGLRPAVGGRAAAPTIQMLLVGAGGAGGRPFSFQTWGPPGGGGGQVLELEVNLPLGVYPVVIGLGGNPVSASAAGGSTTLGALFTAIGGGGNPLFSEGTFYELAPAVGWNAAGNYRPPAPLPLHRGGYPGGLHFDNGSRRGGGGGGGSGGPGGDATALIGGPAGPGKFSAISGTPVEYGRGGPGGHSLAAAGPAIGPGGGGGGGAPGNEATGHPGNPGILIISYETGTQTWLGGDVTQAGNRTIHTLTADGTLTRTA
ncbi:MAG: hypothetical protein IM667_00855 [Phenylobacterium sp.]|uniref:glycine-rich domain-containing protein n=1 Tax=Phenylobacterium sp. TaxID=1871053 RepID=UPI0025DAFE48|nr:hypothetical protein [Phenylobacterium sp.]MCA3711307.1 hypothetical protein [Phenylobacterium sp.]MCA6239160.1 hypothetical protein [Phenylobacterium sp.]